MTKRQEIERGADRTKRQRSERYFSTEADLACFSEIEAFLYLFLCVVEFGVLGGHILPY